MKCSQTQKGRNTAARKGVFPLSSSILYPAHVSAGKREPVNKVSRACGSLAINKEVIISPQDLSLENNRVQLRRPARLCKVGKGSNVTVIKTPHKAVLPEPGSCHTKAGT